MCKDALHPSCCFYKAECFKISVSAFASPDKGLLKIRLHKKGRVQSFEGCETNINEHHTNKMPINTYALCDLNLTIVKKFKKFQFFCKVFNREPTF